MKKIGCIGNGWLCILLVSMLFLWTCSQTMEPPIGQESKTRELPMSIEKGVPLMDKAASSNFETASFGLG